MKYGLCIICLLLSGSVFGYKFTVWQAPNLPKGAIEQDEHGFKLSMNNTEGTRNYTIAIGSTPDVVVPAQYKLTYKLRGGKLNKNTTVTVHILSDPGNGKKWVTHYSDSFSGDSPDWRTHVMGLDSDFHLSDAMWKIVQVKFHLNGNENPNGYSEIEVRDIRFAPSDELGPEGMDYVVSPNPQLFSHTVLRNHLMSNTKPADVPPLKVYFDLDNEDQEAFIYLKDRTKNAEPTNNDGFSGYLLRGMDLLYRGPETMFLFGLRNDYELMRLVRKPEAADVIVYSRAKGDVNVRHVWPGKKMLVFGSVADKDVKAALPVELSYRNPHDYVQRQTVKESADHEIFKGEELGTAAFGVYYDITLKPGARRILDFADGQPCVVEGDGVIYTATGIGAQLLPDKFFHDRFLLRAILYLGGRATAFNMMDDIGARLAGIEQGEREQQVDKVRKSMPEPTSGDWRLGMSYHNFGRFGYSIAEGLLCYSLRRDLGCENGAQAFRLDIPQETWADKSRVPTLWVNKISWTNKTYEIGWTVKDWPAEGERKQLYSQEVSLLSPFVKYEKIPAGSVLALEGVAEYAVFHSQHSGLTQVRLADRPDFYENKRENRLERPWVLLYRPGEQRPVLLVFYGTPDSLTAQLYDGSVTGIKLGTMHMLCGFPFGSEPVDTSKWVDGLPQDIVDKLDLAAKMALNFPTGCTEIYKIDREAKQVRIVQATSHQRVSVDFEKFQKMEYAVMPPLMAFAQDEGLLVSREWADTGVKATGDLVDLGIPTRFGPLKAVLGRSTLTYSIDLPDEQADILVPGYASDDKWVKEANESFAGGVRWSWGGGGKYEWLTYETPGGGRGGDNISPFGWEFGLPTLLQGYFMLDDKNRAKCRDRVNHRYVEALDQYQYKHMARHRMEPFSGLGYPVMFRSIYPLGINYAKGVGTGFNYGDCNEACTLFTWTGELLAERFGMKSLIQANWPFYKYNMLHQKVMDDWAYHAGSCREDGAGSWIDMLNGEYAGMVSHARLAAMMGDILEEEDALYRAAKRAVPTLLRLRCHKLLGQPDEPKSPQRRISLVTGFGEYGFKTYPNPLVANDNVRAAMDLFDFSQGAPGSLYRLYNKYVRNDIQKYLESFAIPVLAVKEGFNTNERYMQPLAFFATPSMKLSQWTDEIITRRHDAWQRDWPGISVAYPLAMMMWRKHNAPMLTVCQEAKITEMKFDVETRVLRMEVVANGKTRLEFPTARRLLVNGQEMQSLSLRAGLNTILAYYYLNP